MQLSNRLSWYTAVNTLSSKGPFKATQLNLTRRRVELCRYKRTFD